jgi:succinate-semialdehyde dehydrogenase / glutarate-semialdehyde dehydrogenase
MKSLRLLIGGEWADGESAFTVADKFTGETLATVAAASRAQVHDAVCAARRAFQQRRLPPNTRYEILHRAADLVEDRRAAFATSIVGESGFTISDADMEISRTVQTLLACAEEAKRIAGEMVPIDGAPGQENRLAFTIRVPVGVVCAITPFNSPLNTVAHKVGPALAAGNTVVLKPASITPMTATLLSEALVDAGLPAGHLNLIQGGGPTVGGWLLAEPAINFYTFTGSSEVGLTIQRTIGLRRSQLELGSISSTIVCDDADLERATTKCVNASFRKAGQVCTSVQRLYVQRGAADDFVGRLVHAVTHAQVGDPRDRQTLVGPMISVREAERAEAWVAEAVSQGARLASGGGRSGAVFQPTIVLDATTRMRVMCEEIFAPVISIVPFDTLDAAIADVNATPYGLAAGIFTTSIDSAMRAARDLDVGTVHVNETSSSRVDVMPYGGVKESGFGREGPKYSIREMTEERLITWALA